MHSESFKISHYQLKIRKFLSKNPDFQVILKNQEMRPPVLFGTSWQDLRLSWSLYTEQVLSCLPRSPPLPISSLTLISWHFIKGLHCCFRESSVKKKDKDFLEGAIKNGEMKDKSYFVALRGVTLL